MKNYKAKREFGQHFIHDSNIVKVILQKANLNKTDIVLEIGPGKGFMTDFLLEKTKVLAIELDKDLFDFLIKKYNKTNNLEVIQGDCLKSNWQTKSLKPNKLIANIPYNITSPIIFKMLDLYSQFEEIILMMQEDVADRIIANHNSKTYGILSVILQRFYDMQKFKKVPAHMFRPKPKVDSALVKFIPKYSKIDKQELKNYAQFIKFCFNQRRKILFNRLVKEKIFDEKNLKKFYNDNKINIKARAENIKAQIFWEMFKIK